MTVTLAPHVTAADFNRLPPTEREPRWRRVRAAMAERGIDLARWNDMNGNIRCP